MSNSISEDTRLLLKLLRTPAFRFIIVSYNHASVIKDLEQTIRAKFPDRPFHKINTKTTNYNTISKEYRQLESGFFWLENFHDALREETDSLGKETQEMTVRNKNRRDIVAGLNLRRDLWAKSPVALFVLINTPQLNNSFVKIIMEKMPDLWSFRSLTMDLSIEIPIPDSNHFIIPRYEGMDFSTSLGGETIEEKQAELDRLNALLATIPEEEVLFRNSLITQIKELNNYINKVTFGNLENNYVIEIKSNDSTENNTTHATPNDIMGSMYDLSGLADEEQAILSNFAVLPAEHIAFGTLKTLLQPADEPAFRKAIKALSQKGWLEYREAEGFKCSPVVQEITRLKNAPRLLPDCNTLIQSLITGLNSDNRHTDNYRTAAAYAHLGEAVIYAIAAPDDDVARLCQNIGNYHSDTGNLSQALSAYLKMVDIQAALCESQPDNADFKNGLAISYAKLGETHTALGNLQQALTFFEDYNKLENELYAAWPNNVEFKNGLAISYQFLGNTHTALGNLQQALTFFEDYNKLENELYAAWPNKVAFKNGLAISYQFLGNTHTALGNLQQALTFFEKDIELSKELYAAYPNNVSFKNGLAISYEKLGDTHTALGNLQQALTFFDDETTLFEELYAAYPNNVSFKNGLAISYSKLGDTHTALGNLQQALTFFEDETTLFEELYAAYPTNVSFKNGLAVSYAKLGAFSRDHQQDSARAQGYFRQAETLWRELVRDAPQVVEFQRFLAQVERVLAGL